MVKRIHVLFVIGLVIGAGGVVALDLAGSDGAPINNGVPLGAEDYNSTIVVYGDTNASLSYFTPSSGTVEVVTEEGNLTMTALGSTHVEVLNTAITGDQTKLTGITAGGTWIEVNPEDKASIEFRGDLNELYWSKSFDLESRTEDVYISGPDGGIGTVRYSDFPADTQIAAYDVDTGNILDVNTTTANGEAAFDIDLSSHSVSFETTDSSTTPPDLSNFEPSDGTTVRWANETLAVDVSDPEFDNGDEVEVEFTLDGSVVSTQNITSNQTVSYSATGLSEGDHSWSVEATDTFGNTESSSSRTFTVEHYEPEASNLQPEGGQSTDPTEVSADISDRDFALDGDSLTVEIYIDGSLESTQTITSNQTVSTAIPSNALTTGEHSYRFHVTDDYDNSINATETWQNPGRLEIYEETPPHDAIDNTTVSATVTGEFGSVDLGTTDDGTFNFSGLPPSETYVFTLDAEGYFSRSFFVEDIFSNRSAFLLNNSKASVANRITVSDRTGKFTEGTAVIIDRVINTSEVAGTPDNGPEWVTIAGDRLGASEFFDVDLEEGTRYRFRVRNADGDTRILSEYSAKSDGQIDLKIGSISYSFGDAQGYQWDVSTAEIPDGNYSISFAYNDNQNLTSELDVTIKTRENGTVIDSGTFDTGPYGEIVFTTTVSNSTWQNNDFEVVWNAQRDGEEISGNRYIGGGQPLALPLDGLWQNVAYATMAIVLAFLVGAGAGPAAAMIAVGLWSGFAVYIELAPPALGAGATILVIAMGAIIKAQQTSQQVRGV